MYWSCAVVPVTIFAKLAAWDLGRYLHRYIVRPVNFIATISSCSGESSVSKTDTFYQINACVCTVQSWVRMWKLCNANRKKASNFTCMIDLVSQSQIIKNYYMVRKLHSLACWGSSSQSTVHLMSPHGKWGVKKVRGREKETDSEGMNGSSFAHKCHHWSSNDAHHLAIPPPIGSHFCGLIDRKYRAISNGKKRARVKPKSAELGVYLRVEGGRLGSAKSPPGDQISFGGGSGQRGTRKGQPTTLSLSEAT